MLIVSLDENPSEEFCKKYGLKDVTEELVTYHVIFSQARFAWELEAKLNSPKLFKPTFDSREFPDAFTQYLSIIKNKTGLVRDDRMLLLLPFLAKEKGYSKPCLYLNGPGKGSKLAQSLFSAWGGDKVTGEGELQKWLSS